MNSLSAPQNTSLSQSCECRGVCGVCVCVGGGGGLGVTRAMSACRVCVCVGGG